MLGYIFFAWTLHREYILGMKTNFFLQGSTNSTYVNLDDLFKKNKTIELNEDEFVIPKWVNLQINMTSKNFTYNSFDRGW